MSFEGADSWMSPARLAEQESEEIAKAERGLDVSAGDYGSYYVLLKRARRDWARLHAIVDMPEALAYARQAAALIKREGALDILDVGCGPGAVSEALRRQWAAARVTGIDISRSAVAYASAAYPDCRFLDAGIDPAGALPGRFDLIHAREFFPFTRSADPRAHREMLALFARHLNPGGAVLLGHAATPWPLADAPPGCGLRGFETRIESSARLAALPAALARGLTRLAQRLRRGPQRYFFIARSQYP